MNPIESKVFLKVLGGVALLWFVLGSALFYRDSSAQAAFYSVYSIVLLDLVFLILLFWTLFFSSTRGLGRSLQAFIYFTFKLVCLGFLAITLKRLRNDPHLPSGFAILFMGLGPVASAAVSIWIARKRVRTEQG